MRAIASDLNWWITFKLILSGPAALSLLISLMQVSTSFFVILPYKSDCFVSVFVRGELTDWFPSSRRVTYTCCTSSTFRLYSRVIIEWERVAQYFTNRGFSILLITTLGESIDMSFSSVPIFSPINHKWTFSWSCYFSFDNFSLVKWWLSSSQVMLSVKYWSTMSMFSKLLHFHSCSVQ